MLRLGIDLGGTKTEIIALDADGSECLRRRVATPGSYAGVLDMLATLVAEAEGELGQRGSIGIGTPGAPSAVDGRLKNSNSVCLNGQPLLRDLRARLGRPVTMSNDANCFVLSEATDGAAAGDAVVFGVIIGTGTGAGIAVHGRVLTGANAIAGEWGHNPLPWPGTGELPGAACYCGKHGCIETWVSGPGLRADHQSRSGTTMEPPAIAEAAANGDAAAEESLTRYEDRLARSLAHVINLLDPDTVVLGGGMGNIVRLYDSLPRLWGRYIFSDRVDTRLVPPRYGDSSGVRGAAWLGALDTD
jgi:fructokinase